MGQPSSNHPDIYDRSNSLVKSVPTAQTDINQIVARFEKTGQLPINSNPPVYDDVSGYADGLLAAKMKIDEILAKVEAEKKRHERFKAEQLKKPKPAPAPVPEQEKKEEVKK